MTVLITGGAGFIGSTLVRQIVEEDRRYVVLVDKVTYAANHDLVAYAEASGRCAVHRLDICDVSGMEQVFRAHRPAGVLHLAAESHVDRSIEGPASFVQTNAVGTAALLDVALRYWRELDADAEGRFRFHHVSTDEVYGSLDHGGHFDEQSPYRPNSPYAASKAAADHFVRAWQATYGLPVVITNCSNNYGPWQFPEKLIPLAVIKALGGEPVPVYGRGDNVRDWLHVEDHARALRLVYCEGRVGETYVIGGRSERTNLQVVEAICRALDRLCPDSPHRPHARLITFVDDRPGHDKRYAIDCGKMELELGWRPEHSFESGLVDTVRWYLEHRDWWQTILASRYAGERLGLSATSSVAAPPA